MTIRPAAPCIIQALAERCKHENWGYLSLASDKKNYRTATTSYVQSIVSWNKRRYGLDIDPDTVVISNRVHTGLIAALKTFSPPGSKVLLRPKDTRGNPAPAHLSQDGGGFRHLSRGEMAPRWLFTLEVTFSGRLS